MFQVSCFLNDFLSGCSVHYCQWNIKVPYHYCVAVKFCLHVCQCLLYVFRCFDVRLVYTYNCYIFLMIWPFNNYIMTFFLSRDIFDLVSILSDISIATPALFWLSFVWNIFFHLLTFSLHASLNLKQVSCRQHITGSCSLFTQLLYAFWLGTLIHLYLK